MIAAAASQVAFHYAQFDKVTFSGYSVGGEGFSCLSPKFGFVLLSKERGLFVFSPVIILAAAGLLFNARSVPAYVWPAVANSIIQVYLIAAWSSPEQGDSFGSRMWADNAAVVGYGVAIAFQKSTWSFKVAVTLSALTCLAWTCYRLMSYVGAA